MRIRGKGDSVYYQVGYYLCPFVLDGDDKHAYGLGNGELSANYIDPLNKSVTSWILLGREKSSIAINLRTAMMSYENEMTIEQMVVLGPGVSAQIYDYNKGMHRSVNFFVKYISKFPKAKAISEMEDSLWPARETFTKYSYEQAEKACRESQNFTGE